MISWAADIAAYFQVEDTYKSVDVTVPLTALQACVASALEATPVVDAQNSELPAVPVCFPNFHTFGTLTDLPILAEIKGMYLRRGVFSARRQRSSRSSLRR